jgi:hypothetical protein
MDPSGLVFGVLGTADVCIRYGKKLVDTYRAYRDADSSVREMLLRLESICLKTEAQVNFLRRIWNALPGELQLLQNHQLQVLQTKLHQAQITFDAIIGTREDEVSMKTLTGKKGEVRRAAFALGVKNHISRTLDDLDKWQASFDPPWYLVALVDTPAIDAELRQARAMEPQENVTPLSRMHDIRDTVSKLAGAYKEIKALSTSNDSLRIPESDEQWRGPPFRYSSSRMATVCNEMVILDSIRPCPSKQASGFKAGIFGLAQTLAKVDPFLFGLLACRGIIGRMEREDQGEHILRHPYKKGHQRKCSRR